MFGRIEIQHLRLLCWIICFDFIYPGWFVGFKHALGSTVGHPWTYVDLYRALIFWLIICQDISISGYLRTMFPCIPFPLVTPLDDPPIVWHSAWQTAPWSLNSFWHALYSPSLAAYNTDSFASKAHCSAQPSMTFNSAKLSSGGNLIHYLLLQ